MSKEMQKVIMDGYFSKADAFILPLTGIHRVEPYEINSYLFWRDHTIQDYKLTVVFNYDNYDQFLDYCRNYLFPLWDKKGYILESYDFPERSVFVLDLSEWAMDIEQFLGGKYRKLNQKVKDIIFNYHNDTDGIPIHIYATLYPQRKMQVLDGMTPIEYAAKNYELDYDILAKIGEIGGIYLTKFETLYTEIDQIVS